MYVQAHVHTCAHTLKCMCAHAHTHRVNQSINQSMDTCKNDFFLWPVQKALVATVYPASALGEEKEYLEDIWIRQPVKPREMKAVPLVS